jgi:anthranilate phosphoribosyltransferase
VVGIQLAKPEQLVVNTRDESIASTLAAICGRGPREKEDMAVLNTSAALVVGKVAKDLREGVEIARGAIKGGAAQEKLAQLVKNCGNLEMLEQAEKKFL